MFKIHAVKPKKSRKLKVGWISPENWEAAQTRIRVLNVSRWLNAHGVDSQLATFPSIINDNFDVAIVGKNFSEAEYQNIMTLKEQGKPVYCDLCEDLLEGFPWVKEILGLCDKIICCSPELAKRVYEKVGVPVAVIEDAYEA